MSVTVDRHDHAQRADALAKANATRTAHSAAKKLVAAGILEPGNVVLDPSPELRSMRVLALVQASPMLGPVKARRALNRAGVRLDKRLAELTPRQRDALAQELS